MKTLRNELRDELDKYVCISINLRNSKLKKIGLYKGQPIILKLIEDNPGLSQKEFAELANISKPTLNVMLGRLQKNNLVEIKHDNSNYKISKVYLTEKGKEKSRLAEKILEDLRKIQYADFSKEEIEIFNKLLNKMNNNLEKEMKEECIEDENENN